MNRGAACAASERAHLKILSNGDARETHRLSMSCHPSSAPWIHAPGNASPQLPQQDSSS